MTKIIWKPNTDEHELDCNAPGTVGNQLFNVFGAGRIELDETHLELLRVMATMYTPTGIATTNPYSELAAIIQKVGSIEVFVRA